MDCLDKTFAFGSRAPVSAQKAEDTQQGHTASPHDGNARASRAQARPEIPAALLELVHGRLTSEDNAQTNAVRGNAPPLSR